MRACRLEASTLGRVAEDQFLNLISDIGHVRDHIVSLGQDLLPYRERQPVPAQHHGSTKLLHDKAIGWGFPGEHRAAIVEVSMTVMWMRCAFEQPILLHGWAVGPWPPGIGPEALGARFLILDLTRFLYANRYPLRSKAL